MKQWRSLFRSAVSKEAIREQLKPGSHFVRIVLFSLVASLVGGFIYYFVGQNLGGARANTEAILVTTGASRNEVGIGEEFTVDVLFSAPAGRSVSQLDLRMRIDGAPLSGNGEVSSDFIEYIPDRYESAPVGTSLTNYFDTEIIERFEPGSGGSSGFYRLVISSRRPDSELAQRVVVRIPFRARSNGIASFSLDAERMEIVGPGGASTQPVSFVVGSGSSTSTQVRLGSLPVSPTITETSGASPSVTPTPDTVSDPTPTTGADASEPPTPRSGTRTPTPMRQTDSAPTPTITIAPNPTCSNRSSCLPLPTPVPVSVAIGMEPPVS